jgi:hypothetical protein
MSTDAFEMFAMEFSTVCLQRLKLAHCSSYGKADYVLITHAVSVSVVKTALGVQITTY